MDEIKFEDIPDYADVFTLADFQDMCKTASVTNYDGIGYFAYDITDYEEESYTAKGKMAILPITIKNREVLNVPGFCTHIAWFNK